MIVKFVMVMWERCIFGRVGCAGMQQVGLCAQFVATLWRLGEEK